jgi:hypothetical protein
MPPKRQQHPLLSSFMASHPRVIHAATVAAAQARRTPMAKHIMGGIGGFGMMPPKMSGAMSGAMVGGLLLGGAKKPKRETVGRAKNQARGAIVRQVMMQHGMTLPQASHYVKVNNIKY